MKRYLVFAGSQYYPYGGWSDFQGDWDTLAEAVEYSCLCGIAFDWWHIVDTTTKQIVKYCDS